ncbi:MAG: winged helix-turn-helix transcriptional regulator [Thermoplasmata archaeon]|nr:winged helix-turn-helix transcriptional regulator [Thermoplasmata archaeon]
MHRAVPATFVLLIAACSIVAAPAGGTVHVDSTYGGAAGPSDGTEERPFVSIAAALGSGDDPIVVHGGQYNESVVLQDVTLVGMDAPLLRGHLTTHGDAVVTGMDVAPPAPSVLVIDLDHGQSPSDRAEAWRAALGDSLAGIVGRDDALPFGEVDVIVLTGEGSDVILETAMAALLDEGVAIVLDGPVHLGDEDMQESLLGPMAGVTWAFTMYPPSDTLRSTIDGFLEPEPPVTIGRLNGGYYYLASCEVPAIQARMPGEWRPVVGLSRSGIAVMSMPLVTYDAASREPIVGGLMGTVPVIVSSGDGLWLENSTVHGDALSVSGVTDLVGAEVGGIRVTGGKVREREWLHLEFEDFEGRPLRDVDVLVRAWPVGHGEGMTLKAYATPLFRGTDPSPGPAGDLYVPVPVRSHDALGGHFVWIGELRTVSNWVHMEDLGMDGPETLHLVSPDPAPRSVSFLPSPFTLSGATLDVAWNSSADVDLAGYELRITGSDGTSLVERGLELPRTSIQVRDGIRYDIELSVVDIGGRRSVASAAWTLVPNLPPPAPDGVSVTAVDTARVEVSWIIDDAHDLDRFEVTYSDLDRLMHDDTRGPGIGLRIVDPGVRSVMIDGLSEDAAIWVRVTSVDHHGASRASALVSGRTVGTPPEVTFDPIPATVSADVAVISGMAEDERQVVRVEYQVDSGQWRHASGRERWAFFLDATSLDQGEHEIAVRATDGAGTGTGSYTVSVARSEGGTARVPVPPYYYAILAAGTFLVIMALTQTGTYLMFSAMGLLYARLTGKKVLDNYVRGKIHGYIIANPGGHYSEIMRKLGLTNGLFAYHVKVLERESLVKSVIDGRLRRFYPIGMRVESERELDTVQVRLLNIISENPGITQKELSLALGLRKQMVNLNVRAMYHAGLVDIVKSGRETHLYLISPEEGGDAPGPTP